MMRVGGRIRSLDIMTLFRWFVVYSIMGWTYETVFVFLIKGNLTNRGFLFGPLCPIYGLGILIMILICSDRGKNIASLMIKCSFVATAMEYITSFWMEEYFNRRWWDYSDMFMNINGRICIGASLLFGVMGAIFVRYLHPSIVALTSRISDRVLRILDRTVLVVFLYDILLSFRANI